MADRALKESWARVWRPVELEAVGVRRRATRATPAGVSGEPSPSVAPEKSALSSLPFPVESTNVNQAVQGLAGSGAGVFSGRRDGAVVIGRPAFTRRTASRSGLTTARSQADATLFSGT